MIEKETCGKHLAPNMPTISGKRWTMVFNTKIVCFEAAT